MYSYTPRGVCAQKINFTISEGIVKEVSFLGGCSGNLKGISQLIEGMHVDEAIARLKGIECGPRATSCPDQLASALEVAVQKEVS
ncbi:TIGR03905 family TSCPD domain-containing protein [Serpentinicella sp. ANB-PHB4]|uniref:TIGR03905 family TSCPD domain-containing protein n=1 Tax=Serpentinicella sp. ANB-PHB4 TaxID=3074076 RepID=UPI00285BAFF5|nr:TIGR03905 family TSCPD domain-containing protein [Serpentinicella sp. ANB-PHB4]MDR5657918.1 TIGR03905 family TSCPD domain-containing protein [Serpentinicella sp. ANB-PHB4]